MARKGNKTVDVNKLGMDEAESRINARMGIDIAKQRGDEDVLKSIRASARKAGDKALADEANAALKTVRKKNGAKN